MDDDKVKAIRDWPSLNTITKVHNFNGLATCYRRFVRKFSGIVALITNCIRNEQFMWVDEAERSFKLIKEKFSLPDFEKVLELEWDACRIGIRAVLSH